jgi:hypothetical protein
VTARLCAGSTGRRSKRRGSTQGRPCPSGRRRGRHTRSRAVHSLSVKPMPRVRLARANRNPGLGMFEMVLVLKHVSQSCSCAG